MEAEGESEGRKMLAERDDWKDAMPGWQEWSSRGRGREGEGVEGKGKGRSEKPKAR
jgi:hypothetical protein